MEKFLKRIFDNSIIGKFVHFILKLYKLSLIKGFFDILFVIVFNSNFKKNIDKYMASTPKYKYSFIKTICEFIYKLIFNGSRIIYEFFYNTIIKSKTYEICSYTYKNGKNQWYKATCLSFSMLFLFFAIGKIIVNGTSKMFLLSLILCFISILCFYLDKFFIKLINGSILIKFLKYLLTLEV